METIIEKVMLLQNVELFSDVPTEQLSHLASIAEVRHIDQGKILFHENDPSDALYILISGKINMVKNNSTIYEIGDFEAVGTLGFFDQEPRIFTAVCEKPCRMLEIDSTAFFDLLEERIHIARYLLKYFVKRLRAVYDGSSETLILSSKKQKVIED
ncbi:MAG: Crp/Fnr family transcriptional regulator [Balneolaceae bacterium]